MIRTAPFRQAIFVASFLIIWGLIAPCLVLAEEFKVIKVYDGDTIKAQYEDNEINVRLVGIDAPELSPDLRIPRQPYSDDAKAFLEGFVLNKDVKIRGSGYMGYDVVLGEVFLEDKNVNLELVRSGLAEVLSGNDAPSELILYPYQKTQLEAKNAERGIWSLGNSYESPGAWRKKIGSKSALAIILYGIMEHGEKK